MAALHDLFAKNVLYEALDAVRKSEMEKPIAPLDEQFIDVYCEPLPNPPPPEQVPHLGLLRRMTERRCMLEPFSSSPSVDALDGDLRKQFNLHHRLRKDLKDEKLPKPLLWVLSPGRPEDAMAGFDLRPAPGWPAGFYCGARALHCWLVVIAELPETPETRLLRLLGAPKTRRKALQEISDLPTDDPHRQPLLEILVEVRYLLGHEQEQDPEEQEFMTQLRQQFEQFKAELRREATQAGLRQGQAEGEAAGMAKGKAEALLAVLAARRVVVDESVRAKVLACRDQATLDRWLVQALTAASADEVLAAA